MSALRRSNGTGNATNLSEAAIDRETTEIAYNLATSEGSSTNSTWNATLYQELQTAADADQKAHLT